MAKDERKAKQDTSRDERLERIRRLLEERGEDAAKIVKTWLGREEEKKR